MKKLLKLNYEIIKKGERKGQLNTVKKKLKFIGRTILTYRYSNKITEFILGHEYLKNEIYKYPILVSKIHRPYLHKDLETIKKAHSVIESYQFIDNYFSKDIREILYLDGKYLLSNILGKDGQNFKLYLCLYPFFDKEGEINLKLEDENNEVVGTVTFGILENDIFIGGVQGARRDLNQDYIKNITKELYGLFPKRILLEALYGIISALDLNIKILATGNEMHVYKSKRYIKKRVINSSYDEFWASINGIKNNENIWILPEKLERKNIEEIPSKKRSQTLKKYQLLTNIYLDISQKFN